MLSPRQIFEDNIRPAELLLKVYRLLEHDEPNTEVDVLKSLREIVKANDDEAMIVIYNEVFLGLIRERAQVPHSAIRRSALLNLLRQAVVCSCTALETYLPALLTRHLEEVVRYRGRNFIPSDQEVATICKGLTFSLDDAVRLLNDPDPFFVANKLIGYLKFTYLTGWKGIHFTGLLLTVARPGVDLAARLGRNEKELKKIVDDTGLRRNDIVHRADRPDLGVDDAPQDISFSWALQAVETIRLVCTCLDELVAERLQKLRQSAPVIPPRDQAT
jgi:hypothetical protein